MSGTTTREGAPGLWPRGIGFAATRWSGIWNEPVLEVVVQGVLNGPFRGSGSPLAVFDYVVDFGGALLCQECVDMVSGSAAAVTGVPCI